MTPDRLQFGENFELDWRAYELRISGQSARLSRIPMELLCLLAERQGELVTRDEIVERIWGKKVFVDTDNSINAAVRKLRQVLGDDPENAQFVQTVTGRGYRFIAPVVRPAVESSVSSGPVVPLLVLPQLGSRSRPKWVLVVGLALTLIAILYFYFWRVRQTSAESPQPRLMLAVLPFENFTGDPSQDYFSDGLTEEMISQLGNLDPKHLGVIARTSVMHYKHTQAPLDQIGKELGIQYVLEGSVRRDSEKVRITAQLIQVKDLSHVWARQYDRELSSLITLQGEIAQQVANEIQITLGNREHMEPQVVNQPPLNPGIFEAYDLYLKGRYFWNKRTPQAFEQAIDYFQQAVAKNPSDARSYAGLADSYALMSGYRLTPQTETMPKARVAALRALELNGELAEAHTSLALISENYDWDWQKAETEFRRAIQLNPNYATAHEWYAEYLAYQGRFAEAFAESERARQLDPLSLIIAADDGAILYYSRQYDMAIAKFRAVQEMEPNFFRARMVDAAYIEKGRFKDAIADVETWTGPEDEPWRLMMMTCIYSRSGDQARASTEAEKLFQVYKNRIMDPSPILFAYIAIGNKDEAFKWLERAYVQHSNLLTSMKVNPFYDSLRDDPRFSDLMRRVKLIP
jgi:TolB-like protein/DNA-binding winged helix-turn-helix (wHTH) protein/Flp pilus assembly protein TadD